MKPSFERRPGWFPPVAGWFVSIIMHAAIAAALLLSSTFGQTQKVSVKEPPKGYVAAPPEPFERSPLVENLQIEPDRIGDFTHEQINFPESPDLPDESIIASWRGKNSSQVPGKKLHTVPGVGNNVGRFRDISSGYSVRHSDGIYNTSFCGTRGKAGRICYIIDCSGSMVMALDYVQYELKRALADLTPAQSFQIIFFAGAEPQAFPERSFARANTQNHRRALQFIDRIGLAPVPDGEAAWHAMVRALSLAFDLSHAAGRGPELIYLLTDGEFNQDQVFHAIGKMQSQRYEAVAINVIACGNRDNQEFLQRLAGVNKGQFHFISDEELARPRKGSP